MMYMSDMITTHYIFFFFFFFNSEVLERIIYTGKYKKKRDTQAHEWKQFIEFTLCKTI